MRTGGYVLVLVLVGAVVAAVPGVDGYLYQQKYTQLIDALAQNGLHKVKITNYRMGWLNSDAELTLDLNPANSAEHDPNLVAVITQHITHGPLVQDPITNGWVMAQAAIHSQLHLPKQAEAMLLPANESNGIIQVDTLVSFNDQYQNQVKTPVITIKTSANGKLSWQGISGQITVAFVDNKLRSLKSDLTGGSLQYQDAANNVSMPTLKIDSTQDCGDATLCTVASEMTVPTVDMMQNTATLKLAGLSMKTTYGLDPSRNFNANFELGITKFTAPDYTVGPAKFQSAASGLNSAGVSKFYNISRTAAMTHSNSQADKLVLLAQFNKELPTLITAHTTFQQNLAVATSFGDVTATAKFFWPVNAPLPTTTQDLAKMNMMVDMHAATALVQLIIKGIDAEHGFTDSETYALDVTPAGAAAASAATAAATPAAVPPPAVAPKHVLDDLTKMLLTPYVAQKKLSPTLINAISTLQKQHLSPAIYDTSIDKMMLAQHLPKDELKQVIQQLKDQYAANYSESEDSAPADTTVAMAETTTQPAVKTPAAPVPSTIASNSMPANNDGLLKKQLDTWVRQGYITVDNNNYIVSIVYDGTTMKVGGVVIPLGNSITASQ